MKIETTGTIWPCLKSLNDRFTIPLSLELPVCWVSPTTSLGLRYTQLSYNSKKSFLTSTLFFWIYNYETVNAFAMLQYWCHGLYLNQPCDRQIVAVTKVPCLAGPNNGNNPCYYFIKNKNTFPRNLFFIETC